MSGLPALFPCALARRPLGLYVICSNALRPASLLRRLRLSIFSPHPSSPSSPSLCAPCSFGRHPRVLRVAPCRLGAKWSERRSGPGTGCLGDTRQGHRTASHPSPPRPRPSAYASLSLSSFAPAVRPCCSATKDPVAREMADAVWAVPLSTLARPRSATCV